MECQGMRVAVIGAGRSGVAAAIALHRRGAQVAVYDRQPLDALPHAQRLLQQGIPVLAETDAPNEVQGFTHVVVSPGIPPTHPIFGLAARAQIPVWSEIELAYRLSPAPIIAVTGTNGKTTTTALIHHILQTMGLPARLCGNIAGTESDITLTEAAEVATPEEWLVAEVSSFQLLHTHTFRPRIAVITNIREDHLDYHGNWEAYALAKAKILANQTPDDWAVLNGDDAGVRWVQQHLPQSAAGKHVYFSHTRPTVALADGELNLAETPMPALAGVHGLENALAAASVAAILGCGKAQLQTALQTFRGVPHRMELVGEWAGVRYINNSMCTNADALEHSLQAAPKPCIVIAGGVDKNNSVSQLAHTLARHADYVLLMGRDGQAIGAALSEIGFTRWEYVHTLERAVARACAVAKAGDTVILAPGCASFDQFRNFAERGERFRQLVQEANACAV
ncbi:MAG: UDP-N-acetylmuramoyl-L-alanine--D-glutamate ligase [Fimbriimonadales bacterium]|nr:UDP-N-acetylmuramoyl-L-alanine--D-glutamate ligase [Fimbriimonadales bacterium]MDW8052372.1 UDP-N-acetylmuramoyl-L-alanine--D-glutamate ligase [Armatimonadota bacterium]